ncbi:antitrypsin-like isoform X2 [Leptopilina boulardi]|uniref:antitrypsin-like isoform X2 n=1 Tax=Leptopilina boulardi TaxID=63433 RepID=UPI0021F68FBB|nr:antitrypsin-like isoform X2 [Leptopilina boulardi]
MNFGSLTFCITMFIIIVIYGSNTNAYKITDNNYLSRGVNKFSVKLFKFASMNETGNIIISPLTIHVILSIFAFNSTESTIRDFENVLELRINNNYIFTQYRDLIDNLRGESIASTTPNSIKAFSLIDVRLREITTEQPSSEMRYIDIYFNAEWREKFSKYSTTRKFFYNGNTNTRVQMMSMQSYFEYGRITEANATFIKIPFRDNDCYMLIVLPDDMNGLRNVEDVLETLTLEQITRNGLSTIVDLNLPKFKVNCVMDLKVVSQKMGIDRLLTNYFFNNDHVESSTSQIIHQATINISEGGTKDRVEDGYEYNSFVPLYLPPSVRFNVNHPFHYKIIKRINNNEEIVLFVGNIKTLL